MNSNNLNNTEVMAHFRSFLIHTTSSHKWSEISREYLQANL